MTKKEIDTIKDYAMRADLVDSSQVLKLVEEVNKLKIDNEQYRVMLVGTDEHLHNVQSELDEWRNGVRIYKCFECGGYIGPIYEVNLQSEVNKLKTQIDVLINSLQTIQSGRASKQTKAIIRTAFDKLIKLEPKDEHFS